MNEQKQEHIAIHVNVNFENCESANISFPTAETPSEKESNEYIKYRVLADKIQIEVYNAAFSVPRDDCLRECNKWITYGVDKSTYNCLFAECEGHADHLWTTSNINVDLANHDIYKCLKLYGPNTSFKIIAYIIYKFSHAAALAISGEVERAMKKANKGYQTLETYLNIKQMAKTNASCLYGYVNVHLRQYSAVATVTKTCDQNQKDEIFKLIAEGIKQVGLLEERDAHIWARMFLVNQAFCYLNIGPYGEDIFDPEDLHITNIDRENASGCLERAMRKHWVETDKRGEMLYKRAKAKLLLLDGQKTAAIKTLTVALDIAKEFQREEKIFDSILQKWKAGE